MIENLIYWTGVAAILSGALLVSTVGLYLTVSIFLTLLVKELKSSYNHIQLYYFMRELKKKGYAQAVEDIGKSDDK